MRVYGGWWQEMRAYVAGSLIGWALAIHHGATMDLARDLTELEKR